MTRTNLSNWNQLWRNLDAVGDPSIWHRRLIEAHSEKQRHYHNLQHLEECLLELDAARLLAKQPAIIEMALWFHDAVYDPRSGTNEEDSANLAVACLTAANLAIETIETVRQLILSTKTHQPGTISDAALLIDIDLAILGQPASRFMAYEQGIKAEYSWVPETSYVQKRTEILTGFLRRPTIYRTEKLKQKYEVTARTNLENAITLLQTSPS
jgi:predicted metal-dependent HD superfamily phosphohydrolase